jgi:gas vesicle protein
MANGRYGLIGLGLSFMAGCLVGGTTALLYAPQSGARTRRRIADFTEDVRDRAGDVTEQAAEKIHNAIERGRNLVNA